MIKAPVSDIFFSYQGEGIYAGKPQVFVRFFGCNIECDYCDTKLKRCEPLDVDQVVIRIDKLTQKHFSNRKMPPSISITGGEPLIHDDFLIRLFPVLKKKGYEIYLETNGTLPDALKKTIRWVDIISMDIKLPSACKRSFWKEHKAFLKLGVKKSFVKVVLTNKTKPLEIKKAIDLVNNVSVNIPLVFQPSTPVSGTKTIPTRNLYVIANVDTKKLRFVSILPQMHKLWGIK